MTSGSSLYWIHYLPVLTTVVAAAFSTVLFAKWRRQPSPHLLWWAIGVAFYGLGTLVEATITLTGNSVFLTKAWYIAGAVLGGYPLAQGSLYLSYSRSIRRVGRPRSVCRFVVAASVLVVLSPVDLTRLELHRPSGRHPGWRWVRLMTPFINGYAAFFLIGGAALSAWRFWQSGGAGNRAAGNALIAAGGAAAGHRRIHGQGRDRRGALRRRVRRAPADLARRADVRVATVPAGRVGCTEAGLPVR